MPLPTDNPYGLSRAIPIRLVVRHNFELANGESNQRNNRNTDAIEHNDDDEDDDNDDDDIDQYGYADERQAIFDRQFTDVNDNRRITFAENYDLQMRRMEFGAASAADDDDGEEEEDDEEFFPVEDTYVEEDEELNESMEDDIEDEEYSDLNAFTDRRSRLLRSSSRSPPPPPYQPITRENVLLSLASMLNNLTTSSNSLNTHLRRLSNRNTMVVFNDDEDDDDNNHDRHNSDFDEMLGDEVHRRWRVLRRNQGMTDSKIKEILNRRMGVRMEETIFKNHYNSHPSDKRILGMKKFDLILEQRQKLLSSSSSSSSQAKSSISQRKSRKRKNNETDDFNDSDEADEVTALPCCSFLQPGVCFTSASSDKSSILRLQFTNVSYDEKVVNGIIFSSPAANDSIFQFNGSIVDFVENDLRYSTIHGTDELRFQSSLDRNVMLNDHNKFLQFKKKLDKWFKLPPFNSLRNKRSFEKILTCHHCLNLVMKNFMLLKLTVLINNKSSLDIEDHLQLLASINRQSGEMYIMSGELDSFQRCSSCNIIHDSNSTGNSIIDKILILNNDHRLKPFKNLLINIRLLNELQNRDWMDIREENVWKDDDDDTTTLEFLSDKKLKKNDNQAVKKKFWKRSDNSSKNSSSHVVKYDYDELFVTRFVPKFNDNNGFNRLEVVLS